MSRLIAAVWNLLGLAMGVSIRDLAVIVLAVPPHMIELAASSEIA